MKPGDRTEPIFAERVAALVAGDIHTFYRQRLLQRAGVTTDTHRPYADITAEVLLQHPGRLQAIGQGLAVRQRSFRLNHDGTASIGRRLARDGDPQGPERLIALSEKLLARALFNQGQVAGLGRIVDYEVPLQETLRSRLGDVDLIATAGPAIKLIELKITHPAGRGESLLRALLEAHTYYKLLENSLDRFVKDYAHVLDPSPDGSCYFQPVILAPADSQIADTVRALGLPEYACLRDLIAWLDRSLAGPFEFWLFTYPGSRLTYPDTRRPGLCAPFEVVRADEALSGDPV